MLNRDYQGQVCSIARTLEVVGERWTLLIIRDAFFGLTRFDQFRDSLGIARNVLTERLGRLVDEGIFERIPYSDRPPRHEYRLTDKGRDLAVALSALRQWGDKYLSPEPPVRLQRRSDHQPVLAMLMPADAQGLDLSELELVPGPGRQEAADGARRRPRR